MLDDFVSLKYLKITASKMYKSLLVMIETKGFSLWPFLLLTLDHFDCIVDNFCLFSWL